MKIKKHIKDWRKWSIGEIFGGVNNFLVFEMLRNSGGRSERATS